MIQTAITLPLPTCGTGHRPALVQTRGTPTGMPLQFGANTTWHVECAACGIATHPTTSRDGALYRWAQPELWEGLIPLDQLGRARRNTLSNLATAA